MSHETPYRQLEVWKLSMQLSKMVYEISEAFPSKEIYGLTSQIRRAAVSVPSNIAEGSCRRGNREFEQFLFIAIGSLGELDTQLTLASNLQYVQEENCKSAVELIHKLRAMILSLARSLSRRDSWPVIREAAIHYQPSSKEIYPTWI